MGVLMLPRTLSLVGIVEAQRDSHYWYVFSSAPGIHPVFICGVAETNRAPFDLPEAESELVAGFHTEYSGFRFSLFFLAEYAAMIVISSMAVTLLLGKLAAAVSEYYGVRIFGPHPYSGVLWFASKAAVFILFLSLVPSQLAALSL
jgi:NADH-quinone oxidoreductase subunit H